MALEVINITCPGCGAPIDTSAKNCKSCGRPVVITTFNSVYGMDMKDLNQYKGTYQKTLEEHPDNPEINLSMGMCLLKLNAYDKAEEKFNKAIEESIDNPEAYFWDAVCLLKGKRPFVQTRQIVDQAIDLTNTARMLEDRGIFSYFIAYLKYDYYQLKRLKQELSYVEELQRASSSVTQEDIRMLAEILKIDEFDQNLAI